MIKHLMLGTVAIVTAIAMTPAVAGPTWSTPRMTAFGNSQFGRAPISVRTPMVSPSRPSMSFSRPALSARSSMPYESRPQLGTFDTYRSGGVTVDPLPGGAHDNHVIVPSLTSGKANVGTPELSSGQRPLLTTFGAGRAVDPLPGGGAGHHHVLLPTLTAYDKSNVILKVDPPVQE